MSQYLSEAQRISAQMLLAHGYTNHGLDGKVVVCSKGGDWRVVQLNGLVKRGMGGARNA